MQYDPIKQRLSGFIRNQPVLKILFFKVLRVLFLREWYVRSVLFRLFQDRKPARILDAGCGFGQYSYLMATRFPAASIDSVDLNPAHVSALSDFSGRLNLNINPSVQDLTKYASQESYDFILCVDVIEHIENDRAVFTNFANSLSPGGEVVISTPSDLGGSDHHHDHDHDHQGGHGFIDEHARDGYSIADLKEKLETAGLVVADIRYTYGAFGSFAWKLAVKWPMMLLNLSMVLVLLLPFYFLITLIPILLLHQADMMVRWKSGTGLIARAIKPT